MLYKKKTPIYLKKFYSVSQKKKSLSMKKQKLVKKQVESEIKKLDDGKILNVASNIGVRFRIFRNFQQ